MRSMTNDTEGEFNLVELWLRRDPVRWIAGALAGLFAGAFALAFAMVIARIAGWDMYFPVKYAALPFVGAAATEAAFNVHTILVGLIAHEALCMVLGVIYAQVTGTNNLGPLLGIGFVWGVFSWIFITNLFTPSWTTVLAAQVPSGPVFPMNIFFGLALTSVAFFDRALRGDSNP